ncbi:MAG TPA: hypothetical protein VGD31_02420 [Sphingobacteriaceae bacterium]
MKQTLTFALALSCLTSFAQRQFSIKVYQNTDTYNLIVAEPWKNQTSETRRVVGFSRFSMALTLEKEFIHELELFLPEFGKAADDLQFPMHRKITKGPRFQSQASAYSFRYELTKSLTRGNSPLGLSLGAGLHPYYVQIDYTPTVSVAYPSTRSWFGAGIVITPRITYDITKRLYLDLNVPLRVFDYQYNKEHIRNPAIPLRQQVNAFLKYRFFDDVYTLRFGIAYWIGSRKLAGRR